MKKGFSIVISSYTDGWTYDLSNSFFDSKELASKALVNIVKSLNDWAVFDGRVLDDNGNIRTERFDCADWYNKKHNDICYPSLDFDDDGLPIAYSISYEHQEEEANVFLVEQSINDVDNVECNEL